MAFFFSALFLGLLVGAIYYPEYRLLFYLGLYSVPSHVLISPLPHEPAVLHVAKFFPPHWVAVPATIGACIAGYIDYRVLWPMIHHKRVQQKLDKKRWIKTAIRWFERAPFVTLVAAGLSPLPFYPFKFLSIASRYPLLRYQLALVVGRAPRYWILALLGFWLQLSPLMLAALTVALVLVSFVPKIRVLFDRNRKTPDSPAPYQGKTEYAAPHPSNHRNPALPSPD